MQCRVRCGFAAGAGERSRSKGQLLKVISQSFFSFSCSRNLFHPRTILPLKGLLNKFTDFPSSLFNNILTCFFLPALTVLCTQVGVKLCTITLSFCRSRIVDQIVGLTAKFWVVLCWRRGGSHAQTRAPGKSGSKIDRTQSHHQDWR